MQPGGWYVTHTGVIDAVHRGSSATYPASAPALTSFAVTGNVRGSVWIPIQNASAYHWLQVIEAGAEYEFVGALVVDADTFGSAPLAVVAVNGSDDYPAVGVSGSVVASVPAPVSVISTEPVPVSIVGSLTSDPVTSTVILGGVSGVTEPEFLLVLGVVCFLIGSALFASLRRVWRPRG
jgi:hypothetical protein